MSGLGLDSGSPGFVDDWKPNSWMGEEMAEKSQGQMEDDQKLAPPRVENTVQFPCEIAVPPGRVLFLRVMYVSERTVAPRF